MASDPSTTSAASESRWSGPPTWLGVKWRTGRKVGRTIYAVVGRDASDNDVLIGVMDTASLANEAVNAHNEKVPDAD